MIFHEIAGSFLDSGAVPILDLDSRISGPEVDGKSEIHMSWSGPGLGLVCVTWCHANRLNYTHSLPILF